MGDRIQIRHDTSANWTSANPTLLQGEIGIETDSGIKRVGDGVTAWAALPPFSPPTGMGGYRVGFIGDSITAGQDSYQPTLTWAAENNNSPGLYAMLNDSKNNWQLVQNAGVSGQTSAQILARLATDILANPIDICVIFSCTWNDIGQNVTVTQSVSNVTAMILQCLSKGILPVLCTPTADGQVGSTAARRTGAAERRRIFVGLGAKYRIPVVDLFPVTVDPTTGMVSNTYNADGSVHANPAGRKALGAAVASVLDTIVMGSAIADIGYAGDSDDLLAGNGFFQGTPVAGVAGGWSGSTVTGATPSIYSDPVLGNMQRCTTSATTGNYYFTRGISVTAGHMYEINGYMNKAGTSQAQISVNGTGNRRVTINGTDPDITRGRFSIRGIANATESQTFYLVVGSGTGTVDFGRLTIRDLTALGVA